MLMPESYFFENFGNFRDVGGMLTPYGRTAYRRVFRSATLCGASKEEMDYLSSLGIKTIIDLREDDDRRDK